MLEREGASLPNDPAQAADAHLLEGLLQGSSHATGELFDRYASYIQRVLTRILGYAEPERADLLHEVFVRALEKLPELKSARSLKPWLAGIAVFTAQEWLRSRKRRGPLLPPEDGDARAAPQTSPETRQAVVAFYELVGRFEEHERAAFILRQLEGMSLQEVADTCGVSLSTARRRIERAEAEFQRLLPEYPALLERSQLSRRSS
jgi:RNA polymerase sigma-70 factor (ECF subfamily)